MPSLLYVYDAQHHGRVRTRYMYRKKNYETGPRSSSKPSKTLYALEWGCRKDTALELPYQLVGLFRQA